MATVKGRDIQALRGLAILLARGCVLGDQVLIRSSPSGKGSSKQLDPDKMQQIGMLIRQRVRDLSELEFEFVWGKCVVSISKACQNLRSGRLAMNTTTL